MSPVAASITVKAQPPVSFLVQATSKLARIMSPQLLQPVAIMAAGLSELR